MIYSVILSKPSHAFSLLTRRTEDGNNLCIDFITTLLKSWWSFLKRKKGYLCPPGAPL